MAPRLPGQTLPESNVSAAVRGRAGSSGHTHSTEGPTVTTHIPTCHVAPLVEVQLVLGRWGGYRDLFQAAWEGHSREEAGLLQL